MSQNWQIKKLSEICNLITDGVHNSPKYVESGIPMLDSKHIKDDFSIDSQNPTKFISQETDNLLSKRCKPLADDLLISSRGSIGKIAIVKEGQNFNIMGNIILLRVPNDVSSKYVAFSLQSKLDEIQAISRGVAQKGLYLNQVRNFKIAFPSPLEQKRIVAILDEAFEGIDRAIALAEKNLANSRELFESYLNSKLLGVAAGELKQSLLSFTELIVDCEHKTAPTQETGIPSIRTPNIGKGYLIFDKLNRVSEETYELWTRRAKPEAGDLILAREAPAGNVAVIPEGQKVCLGQRTVLIRPKKETVNSEYLTFLLLHPVVQKRLLAHSTGATVQHVNMKDIRNLPISNLPPIQSQIDCVQELELLKVQANRLEAAYRQKIAALNELKQSILQKAFTGELTAATVEKAA